MGFAAGATPAWMRRVAWIFTAWELGGCGWVWTWLMGRTEGPGLKLLQGTLGRGPKRWGIEEVAMI